MPEIRKGSTSAMYSTVVRGHEAQPGQPDGLQREAHAHQQAATDAVRQGARDGRHEDGRQGPGQDGCSPASSGE